MTIPIRIDRRRRRTLQRRVSTPAPLLLLLFILFATPELTSANNQQLEDLLEASDNAENGIDQDGSESVSFEGEHRTHFTMQVEQGHQFECFSSKEDLEAAVNRYAGYNHIDMHLAQQYGWPIANWCTRDVTDMSDLFYDHPYFNEDIGMWNTAKVTTMEAMFQNAMEFNQDLSGWDTSRVTSMSRMFAAAKSFNGPIGSWTTDRVETTSYMFLHALQFNQDVSQWNMDSNTNMERMFRDARRFEHREAMEAAWHLDQTDANTHKMLSDTEF